MNDFLQCLLGMMVQSCHTWEIVHIKIFILLNLIYLVLPPYQMILIPPSLRVLTASLPKLLKVLATEVSSCLQLPFSASLNQCTVALEWEKSLICPLFKNGNRKDPSNYRPLSLTSVYVVKSWNILYTAISCHT